MKLSDSGHYQLTSHKINKYQWNKRIKLHIDIWLSHSCFIALHAWKQYSETTENGQMRWWNYSLIISSRSSTLLQEGCCVRVDSANPILPPIANVFAPFVYTAFWSASAGLEACPIVVACTYFLHKKTILTYQ